MTTRLAKEVQKNKKFDGERDREKEYYNLKFWREMRTRITDFRELM
jgi:hypothetical protein